MRTLACVLAVFLLLAAAPLIVRLDAALSAGRRSGVVIESARMILAALAATVLFLVAVRTR